MKLRTPIKPIESDQKIDHSSQLLLTGSCFAENIGKQLKSQKFKVKVNPLGISYNPLSIHQLLTAKKASFGEILEQNGVFYHFQLHSEFNQLSEKAFQENLNRCLEEQDLLLSKVSTIFISYGTAIIHELNGNGEIVNNCHKQSAAKFKKRNLTVDEIVNSFDHCQNHLLEKGQDKLQFIFTVSPVRHLKEGYRQNQISKSILHLAVEEIVNKHPHCHYFPSYEIMMDDLRDYRFYEADLIHPNQLAINYIWEIFEATFCHEKSRILTKKIDGFLQAVNHRAFQPKSEAHQHFLKNLRGKIKQFQVENELDFRKELRFLDEQID